MLAALRAFDAGDEAGQFEKQSDLHSKAVDHLQTLANLSERLAKQLKKTIRLPGDLDDGSRSLSGTLPRLSLADKDLSCFRNEHVS